MNYKITVFTPTYNRKHTLTNLYNDLLSQSFKDFEWVIVDDGSNDMTSDLVESWVKEKKLPINYIKKENGGKHTAINAGVRRAKGELFFIVDSDDRLYKESLKNIYEEWIENKCSEIQGIVGLCIDEHNNIIGTSMPKDVKEVYFSELYTKYNVKGDKALLFTTNVMKEFPFPEEEGIKFIMEEVVWTNISKKYKVLCLNKPLMIREYLEDGLTKSNLNEGIAKGQALSYIYLINQKCYTINENPKLFIKKYINLSRFSLIGKVNYFKKINKFEDRLMYIILFPIGYLMYLKNR